MVAHNMHLKRPPPPTNIVPPTGLKIWSDDLDPKLKGKKLTTRDQDDSSTAAAAAKDSTTTSSSAAKGACSSTGSLSWREKQRRVKIGKEGEPVYSFGSFLAAGGGAWVLGLLLFLLWWRPHLYWTGGASTGAFLVGLLLSYTYFANVKRKEQYQQVLSQDPGLKGCQYLLGTLPSWISLTEREKMEWLNRILEEVWPFYDRGICDMVKQIVEPIMEQYRPPGIMKRIFFQELTFGEAPFRVEGIAVRDVEDHIDLEVDVRWVGDANISLGIELPIGGDFTRLNPKVKDIVFVATLKLVLQPLVEEIPGFAAAAVALKGPPIIKYRLDFGSLPSTVTTVVTAPITAFVGFIVDLIVGMFLWPKRLTVPILGSAGWVFPKEDPVIDLEVERLAGRQQGVVRVHVINAKQLKSYDTLTGKSDPFVEVYTTNDHRGKTRVISNNLSPVWDEMLYLPVLEKDTVLRVEMFDHDAVNITSVKEMSALKAGKEFMGRAAVPLAQFISEDGMEDEFSLPLGKGDWTNLEGPGHGEGVMKIGIQYRSIESIPRDEVLRATKGLVFVGVLCCYNLGGPKTASYVTVKLLGDKKVNKESFKTPTIKGQANPRWFGDNKFTLYDVRAEDSLVVTVMAPALTVDDEIGHVTVPMTTIRDSVQFSRWAKQEQQGYIHRDFPLDKAAASALSLPTGGLLGGGSSSASAGGAEPRIVLELEFLPYW